MSNNKADKNAGRFPSSILLLLKSADPTFATYVHKRLKVKKLLFTRFQVSFLKAFLKSNVFSRRNHQMQVFSEKLRFQIKMYISNSERGPDERSPTKKKKLSYKS